MYDAKKDLITVDREIEGLAEKIKLLENAIELLKTFKDKNDEVLIFSPRAEMAFNDLRFYADVTAADEVVIVMPDSAVLIYH